MADWLILPYPGRIQAPSLSPCWGSERKDAEPLAESKSGCLEESSSLPTV